MFGKRSKPGKGGSCQQFFLQEIVGSLNQTTEPRLLISCVEENSNFLVDFLRNNICEFECDTRDNIIITEDGNLEIFPLPLGRIAFTKKPDTLTNVSSSWLAALKGLSFENICCRQNWQTIKPKYANEFFPCGATFPTRDISSGEHRLRDFKMCDTINLIKSETIFHYMKSTFPTYLHAVQEGHSAQLWVGISEINNAVIGINRGNQMDQDIERRLKSSVEAFFSSVFPPLPVDCVEIIIYETTGSVLEDGQPCYQQTLTTSQAQVALNYFIGRCMIEQTEDPDSVIVSVEPETYEMVCGLLLNLPKPSVQSGDEFQLTVTQHICLMRERKDYCEPDYLKNWMMVQVEDVTADPRVIVCVEISLPPNLRHCVCFNPSLDGSDSLLAYTFSTIPAQNGNLRSCLLSPFQIWLRAKGLQDGAVGSCLYSPLTSEDSVRVLILSEVDLPIRSSVLASLDQYTNSQSVSIDFEVNGVEGVESIVDLIFRKHRDILLITTWNSRALALETIKFITERSCRYQTLMFCWLSDQLRTELYFSSLLHQLNLKDVALLIHSDAVGLQVKIPGIRHLVDRIPPLHSRSASHISPRDHLYVIIFSTISAS
jgi:hypothetical protein